MVTIYLVKSIFLKRTNDVPFQCDGASARVTSLQRAHVTFSSRAGQARRDTDNAHRRQRDTRRAHVEKRANKIQACMTVCMSPIKP